MKSNKKKTPPHYPFWSTSSSLKKLCQNYFLTNLLLSVSVSPSSTVQGHNDSHWAVIIPRV